MREVEFSVGMLELKGNVLMVSGRCCKSDICVGDRFSLVYCYEMPGSLDDHEPPEAFDQRTLCLVVEEIEAYQRKWNRLGSGLTARLKLKGDGVERVKKNDFLGGTV